MILTSQLLVILKFISKEKIGKNKQKDFIKQKDLCTEK